MVITPLAGAPLQFGFVATAIPSAPPDESVLAARVAMLERRLWRIAGEVEAAGVVLGVDVPIDVCDRPGFGELSARQWEIVTRLLRGERVPGIAKALYVSQSTVRSHLARIYRTLGVNSQAELLAKLRS